MAACKHIDQYHLELNQFDPDSEGCSKKIRNLSCQNVNKIKMAFSNLDKQHQNFNMTGNVTHFW